MKCLTLVHPPPSKQLANDLLQFVDHADLVGLENVFTNLEENLKTSTNPGLQSQRFIGYLIEALNDKYRCNLTSSDALNFSHNFLENADLSSYEKKNSFKALKRLQFLRKPPTNQYPTSLYRLEINPMKAEGSVFSPQGDLDPFKEIPENELPADIYIGGVEMLGGGLISIIGIAHPAALGVGGVMLGDGLRRVCDGVKEIDSLQQEHEMQNGEDVTYGDGFYEQAREFYKE